MEIWEVTLFDSGSEVGTWDYTLKPQVGEEIEVGIKVVEILEEEAPIEGEEISLGSVSVSVQYV